jgi:twinkle protein
MTLTRKSDGAVVYHCHHCYASGSVQPKENKLSAVPAATIVNNRLTHQHYQWLKSRGISEITADAMRLFSAEKFFSRLSKPTQAIGFPYYRSGALVSAKYRSIEAKDFTQDAGGAHDFFGIDKVEKGQPLIIVEGEMDCLTAIEAGIANVVSVPGGAPVKVADGKVLPTEDKKFGFVWNAREIIDAAPYVVLVTDQDPPGQALAEELARRIGKEKCRLAKFGWKDLNEAWMDDDPTADDTPTERLNKIINDAEPYPINGISEATAYLDKINDLYTKGTGKGFSTGYPSVDNIYTVAPGQLTVVTGYPSSGKSNFVDQLMVNLARTSDWKFAVCSFENQPEVHITRLMELYSFQSFYEGRDRMSESAKMDAFKWVNEHFLFIDTNGEEPSTLESILTRGEGGSEANGGAWSGD